MEMIRIVLSFSLLIVINSPFKFSHVMMHEISWDFPLSFLINVTNFNSSDAGMFLKMNLSSLKNELSLIGFYGKIDSVRTCERRREK